MNKLAFENATVSIAVERNVAAVVWREAPQNTVELREMERAGKRIAAHYKKGSALFNIIVSGKPSFSQEVRDEVTRITSNDVIFNLASAHVLLVDGLVGSAVRAFLSTALLLSRSSTPNKVFGNLDTAAGWVKEKLEAGSEPWTHAELSE